MGLPAAVPRPLLDSDLDALFRFRERLWPAGDYHRSRAYREWNVPRNPHAPPGEPQAWAAFEGGEILAEGQGLPVLLVQDGMTRPASWCIELYALPEARRRGLGSALVAYWAARAGVPLVMGPSRDSQSVFVRQGLKPLGTLDSHVAPASLLGRWRARLRGRALPSRGRPGPTRRVVARFEPEWDAAWTAARRGLTHVRRDHAWLNWRFTAQPGVSYERLVFFEGSAPAGYAVLRTDLPGRCRVADLAALPAALEAVLAGSLERAREMGARVLQLPLFAPSMRERLLALGFLNEGPWRDFLTESGASAAA